uniref:Nuclear receptor domain-containing protein n=1 Tax=Panagrolaimus sp. JU765 TaxID=591449 RepID=A0AC34Q5B6_9BILA
MFPKKCPICETAFPNGKHFGIPSCGACAAFFRRTVSEEKIFPCTKNQYPYKLAPGETVTSCRHCRYLKCIKVGMQVEKVQPRRTKFDLSFRELRAIGSAGEFLDKLINGLEFVEHERHLAFGSVNSEFKISTLSGAAAAAKTEIPLFQHYFQMTELMELVPDREIGLFSKHVYYLWAQVHSIWLTHRQGGYAANRMCYVDRTYVDINEKAIQKIYENVPGLNNIDTIVRLTMPMYFEFRTVVRLIQRYRVDPVEYLVISHLGYVRLLMMIVDSSKKTRMHLYNYHKKLLSNLHMYYTEHYRGEEAIRMGNMTLLIESLQQASCRVQEQVALLLLSGYKTTVEKKYVDSEPGC